MNYNFDELIDRHHTDAIKIERSKTLFGREDVLPLWVADMDFRTPDFILEAIKNRCTHPIMGYTMQPKGLVPAISKWIESIHEWQIKPHWVGFVPGIVSAIAFAIQAYTQMDDEIIIQPPVYYPFIDIVKKSKRTLVYNQLVEINGRYEIDFDDLRTKISPKTRMLLLCNPHNPGGRAWDAETLIQLAELCATHNILVISDEIHSDLTLGATKHIPFATVSRKAADSSLTLMAPTKTFNIPGLVSSFYIIPNEKLRAVYKEYVEMIEQGGGNIFAYIATQIAYEKGAEWRTQMLLYVQKNCEFVIDYLQKHIPQIKPMSPEATYLIWLNCKELGMDTDTLHQFFAQKAGIGLNKGTLFGPGGEYHLRLNVACPRSVLEQAMLQLTTAIQQQ